MKICIIGAGWYGCYIAYLLQFDHDVTIFEKNGDIFTESSYFNQNRLHLGYHYPRSHATRQMCMSGYEKFVQNFPFLIDDIKNNYYAISRDSFIDFETYNQIFLSNENLFHTIDQIDYMKNVDVRCINTKEKIINSHKSKLFFKHNLTNIKFIFNCCVNSVMNTSEGTLINNNDIFDMCFDCTYNQLQMSHGDYIYEKTISLLYERTNKIYNYEGITIMDGSFSSIFPHDISKNEYTLTDVEHTPLIKSEKFENVKKFEITDSVVHSKRTQMEKKILEYIPSFLKEFAYKGFFIGYKTKMKSNCDSRDCNIHRNGNIISVNCGKIIGIFEVKKFVCEMGLI